MKKKYWYIVNKEELKSKGKIDIDKEKHYLGYMTEEEAIKKTGR